MNNGQEEKSWYTVQDLREYNSTASPFLWEPYFPVPSLCGITGPSDCGKSTLMKQFVLAIVNRETEFLGSPLNVVHGRACYLATEDEQVSTWRVLSRQIDGRGVTPTDDSLVFVFDYEALEAYLEENADTLDCVIVDTFADTFRGSTNSLVDVRTNLRPFSDLARKHNLCFVFVHHNVKNSEKHEPNKNNMNGSQALEARLRTVLELRLPAQGASNERLLTVVKCNHLPQEQKNVPHSIKLDPRYLLFDYQGPSSASWVAKSGSKYDKTIWVPRMARRKELGESYREAVEYFKAELPDEAVPSETWFKENYREPVGPSDSKDTERPTGIDSLMEGLPE